LRNRPQGRVGANDLELIEAPLGEPGDGQILVRNIYLSLDPTNRIWMSDREQYLPPVEIGEVMRGTTLGVVEKSRSPRFNRGDVVLLGEGGWRLYTTVDAAKAARVRLGQNVPLTAHLSVLGPTG